MKRFILFFAIAVLAVNVNADTLEEVLAKKLSPWQWRAAWTAFKNDSTTVYGDWVTTGDWDFSGNITFDSLSVTTLDSTRSTWTVSDSAYIDTLAFGYAFATNGLSIGTSKAIVGTTAMTIGDNNQTVAVNSSDWDISTTGVMTGIGNITTDGVISQTLVNGAGASANPYDYTGTLGIMNGSDDFTLFDVNITNANHTGSNTVQVLDVAAITGDAEATETAINIGSGWDSGITTSSPVKINSNVQVNGTINYLGASNNVAETDSFMVTPTYTTTLATGGIYVFKADTVNTGACVLGIVGVDTVALKSLHDADPADNYIEANSMIMMIFDGTNMQIQTPDANP